MFQGLLNTIAQKVIVIYQLSVNCDVKYFLDPVLCFLGPKSKISTTEPVPVNYF
jgi:hypothetical protein